MAIIIHNFTPHTTLWKMAYLLHSKIPNLNLRRFSLCPKIPFKLLGKFWHLEISSGQVHAFNFHAIDCPNRVKSGLCWALLRSTPHPFGCPIKVNKHLGDMCIFQLRICMQCQHPQQQQQRAQIQMTWGPRTTYKDEKSAGWRTGRHKVGAIATRKPCLSLCTTNWLTRAANNDHDAHNSRLGTRPTNQLTDRPTRPTDWLSACGPTIRLSHNNKELQLTLTDPILMARPMQIGSPRN